LSRRRAGIVSLIALAGAASPAIAQVRSLRPDSAEAILERHRETTAIDADGCLKARKADEIVVCGQRATDLRYRLKEQYYEAGDPRGESVAAERDRIMREEPLKCGVGAILKGCGMVGVHVRQGF
jgi:hypothetical protein